MTKAQYTKAYRELREDDRNWGNHHMSDVFSFYEVVNMRLEETPNDPVLQSWMNRYKSDKLDERDQEKQYSEMVDGKPYCFATYGKDNPYAAIPVK